ncbi:MAG: VWA domain-containing protein [Pyrinomonadaceae bacterium]
MKVQRYDATQFTLVSCLAFALIALTTHSLAQAQEKNDKAATPTSTQTQQASTPTQTPTPDQTTKQQEIGDNGVVLVNTDLITLNVTVTDTYGRFVAGLDKKHFQVLDEKLPQDITFFSDDDAPVSVGVIFDVSGSMSGDKIRRAREALSHFIQTSHDSDEYFLIGFNSRAQLLLDKTRDGKAVLDKLTFVQPKSNTALYDACYLGVERVQRGSHPKRAILLISDGQDNDSRYTFTELRRLLKESDVVVYAIGILGGGDPGSSLGMQGQGILEELTAVSGGRAFFPNTAVEMDDTFEKIALELRHQYSIGYKPNNFTNNGKWHRIKVKINPPRGLPHLFVRSKEGYYATVNPR